jgi:hypothetical protein
MLRRLFWLFLGMGVGAGGSFWVTRWVKQTAARYTPERISSDLADSARGLAADLRLAVADGREAMRQREAELRSQQPTAAG